MVTIIAMFTGYRVMWYDKITGSGRGQMCDYKKSLKNLSTIDTVSLPPPPLSLSLSYCSFNFSTD